MKNVKGIWVSRIAGIVLSGIISVLPTGGTALNSNDDIDVNRTNIVAVAEDVQSTNISENECCKGDANNAEIKKDEAKVKTERISPKKKKQSKQLYRTKTGKCYHKGNCSCLRNSKIKVSHKEIKEAELNPCSKCCK